MKIIYSRKQAQAAVEFINNNNHKLTKPLTLKAVCENVLPAWIDSKENIMEGVVFTYHDISPSEIYCVISVSPIFFDNLEDAVPYEIEITEEHIGMQLEADLAILKEMGEQMGMNVEIISSADIEDDMEESNAAYAEDLSKKVIH